MFVSPKKTIRTGLGAFAMMLGAAAGAIAADNAGDIPVKVNLTGVEIADGPIYVSVQTKDNYQSMRGAGTIIKSVTPGNMSTTIHVAEPGDYAVSVWHDLNDNARFDMDDSYRPLDGYGSSSTPPKNRAPKFEDVKIKVESYGAESTIAMQYPS